MKKINVAELLKDCPRNMELDCTIFNNVTLQCVDNRGIWIGYIDSENNIRVIHLTCYGGVKIKNIETKCVIFPKGKTTWEGFVPPCKFKDGDVLFHSDSASNGIFIFKEILQCGSIQKVICYCDYDSEDGFCLGENHTCCWTDSKILHPATKEQREILFQKMKEAGYMWNAETKTLEKLSKFKVGDRIKEKTKDICGEIINVYKTKYDVRIGDKGLYLDFTEQDDWELVPDKFDINTLKPFDKVLVRDTNRQVWIADYFSHNIKEPFGGYAFACIGHCWHQCIPYEGNQYLLGTTDDCDEYFKTWKN